MGREASGLEVAGVRHSPKREAPGSGPGRGRERGERREPVESGPRGPGGHLPGKPYGTGKAAPRSCFRSRFTASAAQRHPPLTPESGPHPHARSRSATAPREGPRPRTNRGDSSATPRPTPPGGPRGSRPALPRLRPPGSPRCSAAADARDVTRRGEGRERALPSPTATPGPSRAPASGAGPADQPGGANKLMSVNCF